MSLLDNQKLYTQIAHMELLDTPQVHIATVVGLSESRVSQILAQEDYLKVKQVVAAKVAHDHQEINDGWQSIEKTAIHNVLTSLKYNRDADFNLKAAIAANRADRRGAQVQPLRAQSGMRATISMPTVVVKMIQGGDNTLVINPRAERTAQPRNRTDVLLPAKVEETLTKSGEYGKLSEAFDEK